MQHTLRISFRALVMITNHIHTGRLVMYLKSLVYRLLHFMAVLALSQTAVFQSQLSGHLLSLKS